MEGRDGEIFWNGVNLSICSNYEWWAKWKKGKMEEEEGREGRVSKGVQLLPFSLLYGWIIQWVEEDDESTHKKDLWNGIKLTSLTS